MTIHTQHDFAHGDHKSRFRAAVDSLTSPANSANATSVHLTVPERLAAVKLLTDAYIAQTAGEHPDAWQLERLASWVLKRDAEDREQARKERQQRKKSKKTAA